MWQAEPWRDFWIHCSLDDNGQPPAPVQLGSENAQLAASRRESDRVGRRGADYVLTKHAEFFRCEPAVNGVISAIAAWDNVSRCVGGDLAEILLHYGEDVGLVGRRNCGPQMACPRKPWCQD